MFEDLNIKVVSEHAMPKIEFADVNRNLVDFLADPLDYLKGPQVKALLLRSATDTLCLKVCHLAADAWGVKKYADLLAAIYRELASDPVFIVRADQVRCLNSEESQGVPF